MAAARKRSSKAINSLAWCIVSIESVCVIAVFVLFVQDAVPGLETGFPHLLLDRRILSKSWLWNKGYFTSSIVNVVSY